MKKSNLYFSALVLFSLLRVSLSAQAYTPDDMAIVENQKAIISIVLSLKESANIREDIFKLDMQNWQSEKDSLQKEKADLQKQVASLPQIERDMQTLKDSLEKQLKLLTIEQKKNRIKKTALLVTVAVMVAEGIVIYFR